MHEIYHTEGFIVKAIPLKEANMQIWLFTRELGLIVATVQGVRKPTAKLRSHLIEYTLVSADLVKGRDVWRLVSAEVIENPFVATYDELSARSFIRALSLVGRLCGEEGGEPELFDHMKESMSVLALSQKEPKYFDTIVLWKILVILGYLPLSPNEEVLFKTPLADLGESSSDTIKLLIKNVEKAIKESHL